MVVMVALKRVAVGSIWDSGLTLYPHCTPFCLTSPHSRGNNTMKPTSDEFRSVGDSCVLFVSIGCIIQNLVGALFGIGT